MQIKVIFSYPIRKFLKNFYYSMFVKIGDMHLHTVIVYEEIGHDFSVKKSDHLSTYPPIKL